MKDKTLHHTQKLTMKPLAAMIAATAVSMSMQTMAAESAGNKLMEEVVVTSQFREQSVQDTPLAITAMSAEQMEIKNLTSIEEIARSTPSVSLQSAAALFGPSIQAYIRGVGQYDFNPAFEPGVGMYIDDVYYATLAGATFDLLDLERVEVLRGPQGTLTGRNSLGGAIKMFTKKPGQDEGGYVELKTGSRNLMSLRGGASFKMSDNFSARIAGVRKEQDGFVDLVDYGCANPGNPEGIASRNAGGNCNWEKLGGTGYTAFRGQLRYETETWSLDLAADTMKQDMTGGASVLRTSTNPNMFCGKFCSYSDFMNTPQGPYTTYDGTGYSLRFETNLTEDLNMVYIYGNREYDSTFGTDDDFIAHPLNETGSAQGGAGGANYLDHEFDSHEIRFNYDVSDNVLLTLGGFISDQTTTYASRQDIGYVGLAFFQNDPVEATSDAIFASMIYNMTEDLTITAGVRRTNEEKDYTYARKEWDGVTPAGFFTLFPAYDADGNAIMMDGLTNHYEGSETDVRFSVDYKLSDDAMIYYTYSTGFKGGGVSPRPFDTPQAVNGAFGPESLKSHEVGGKFDMLEKTLRLNLSAYMYDYEDVQQPIADCSVINDPYTFLPCAAIQNGGDAEATGFEAEIAWMPIDNFNVDFSYSMYDFEWTRIAPAVGSLLTKSDKRIWVPENQWNLGVQYILDIDGGSTLTARYDMSYTDDRVMGGAGSNQLNVKGYNLANATLAWKNANQDMTVSLNIKNLGDEYYELYFFNAVEAFAGTSYSQIGAPREYSISFKKTF